MGSGGTFLDITTTPASTALLQRLLPLPTPCPSQGKSDTHAEAAPPATQNSVMSSLGASVQKPADCPPGNTGEGTSVLEGRSFHL